MSKQGSTLAGVMDAFSIAISIALQYGVPLETYVSKFVNMRFEPAGMTDDPDVRMATSVIDYLFRRLALDHLPYEKRAQLGIFSADERSAQVASTDYGTGAAAAPAADAVDVESACGRRRTPRRRRPRRRTGAGPTSRSAAPPSCSSCSRARRPTRRCASPAARRCARPVPATSARAAAPPAAAADVRSPARQGRPAASLPGAPRGGVGSPRVGDHEGEQANKDRVGAALNAWAAGTGGPFDLLADDATWTIVDNSPVSRTYGSKAEFIGTVIEPFNARMSEPLVPSVRHLFADGDWTIVLFDGRPRGATERPTGTPTPGTCASGPTARSSR